MKPFNGERATLFRIPHQISQTRIHFYDESGLFHMAFAFQQEVATGKAASLCVFQAAILVLFKQRLKKIFFAFQHSKIAKPPCSNAFLNLNRVLPRIIPLQHICSIFAAIAVTHGRPIFRLGLANSSELSRNLAIFLISDIFISDIVRISKRYRKQQLISDWSKLSRTSHKYPARVMTVESN